MGVILACLADVYARRGKANGTDYSIIAEVIVSYTIWKYFRDGSFDLPSSDFSLSFNVLVLWFLNPVHGLEAEMLST